MHKVVGNVQKLIAMKTLNKTPLAGDGSRLGKREGHKAVYAPGSKEWASSGELFYRAHASNCLADASNWVLPGLGAKLRTFLAEGSQVLDATARHDVTPVPWRDAAALRLGVRAPGQRAMSEERGPLTRRPSFAAAGSAISPWPRRTRRGCTRTP